MDNGPRRERKVVSVLFADLVGFTSRAETLDPEDVEAILRPRSMTACARSSKNAAERSRSS
jgi:class 3 adenylate cyclase